MKRPESPSCERNKEPILKVLKKYLKDKKNLLEIGSGTGQHACYFAPEFPDLTWNTSDKNSSHQGIKQWLKDCGSKNIKGPLQFEIGKDEFPKEKFDVVFSSNTFHIMSWKECKSLIKMFKTRLRPKSLVIIYGPFNYKGDFTSESNKEFDQWLKKRDPKSGIRNFEDITVNMGKANFFLVDDVEMPANNRTLIFEKGNF